MVLKLLRSRKQMTNEGTTYQACSMPVKPALTKQDENYVS